MKKNIKKMAAYVLTGMMLLESVIIHLQTEVHSIENGVAKKEDAIEWLIKNQNIEGSWGKDNKLRETSEVLKYSEDDWFKNTDIIGAAKEWLNSQQASNYDDTYRMNSIHGYEQNTDITEITSLQNDDGGWSLNANYASDIFDTSLALEACINAEEIHAGVIKKGIAFLLHNQMNSGAFSYADNKENVYLTAYVSYVLESYIKSVGRNDDSAKIALSEAESYLSQNEKGDELWGVDEDRIYATLMSSIVLAENNIDITYRRIDIIAEKIGEDGSIYGSPQLTAMFISLVDKISQPEEQKVEISDLYIYTDEGEDIKAYTDVYIEPEVKGFDEEIMDMSVVVGTRDTLYEPIEFEGTSFVWNTGLNKSGKYEIFAVITDKITGDVLGVKKKVVEIRESFEVVNSYMNVTPIMYKIASEKEVKINISVDIESNITKNMEALVSVTDKNGKELYSDKMSASGGEDISYLEFNYFSFIPEKDCEGPLYVQAEIIIDGKKHATLNETIYTYLESEGKRVDVSYVTDKEYILPEEDEVNVRFTLEGVGMSEAGERKPADIFVCLDNSWSMSSKDWEQAKLAAEQIVGYLGADDRCTIQYIGDDKVKCELTSDKDTLVSAINSGGINIFGGTKVDRSIDLAIDTFKDTSQNREKIYLLLSDGEPNNLSKALISAENAVAENIKIYTLGLGDTGAEFMQEIADMGGGKYVNSPTNKELVDLMIDMAGDIFSIAGTDVKLSMTLEGNAGYEKTDIVPQPDNIVKNEDGTTEISWDKTYVSLGELLDYNIKFYTNENEDGNIVKLIKDIKLTYTDVSDENIEMTINPIQIRVKNQYVTGTVKTEKDNYVIGENVTITLEAIKEVKDKEVTGVLKITDENGVTVEVLDDAVIIEDALTKEYVWNTKEVVSGTYKTVISWYRNGVITDVQECSFSVMEENITSKDEIEEETKEEPETEGGMVESDLGEEVVKIKGKILLSDKDVLIGEKIDVMYDAVNLGATLPDNTKIKVTMVNMSTQDTDTLSETICNVAVEESVNGKTDIETMNLTEGQYMVMLNVNMDEKQILLGASGFVVSEPQYDINVMAQTGGEVNADVGGIYKAGSVIELTAVPDEGYVFAGWISENGGTFENEYSEITTFVTPENETSVTAMFVKKKYLLTVESGNGGRIVQGVSGSYEEGTEIELMAEAFSGYEFKCWIVNGEGAVENENIVITTFVMGDGDAEVTAVFVEKETENQTFINNENSNDLMTDQVTETTTILQAETNEGVTNQASDNDNKSKTNIDDNDSKKETKEDKSEKEIITNETNNEDSKQNGISNIIDAVKTGDFGERMVIIRNITLMMLCFVLVSMFAIKKEEE